MEANSGKGWTETDATSVREFWHPRIRFRYERLKGVVACMAAEFCCPSFSLKNYFI